MTLLVAHDAGGAEQISSWALRQEHREFCYLLRGPAIEVFQRKLGPITYSESPQTPIRKLNTDDLVVCGTSSNDTKLEVYTWRLAQRKGVKTVAFLDHWKRYPERFLLDDGAFVLPDEVWVTDRWAAELARAELPGANVLIKGNLYQEDVLAQLREQEGSYGTVRYDGMEHVLYISEPGRDRAFGKWLGKADRKGQYLRVRPHPSEGACDRTLVEDLYWAHTVVGWDSMAMAVALRARRRVISLLSPDEALHIPWEGIERLGGSKKLRVA